MDEYINRCIEANPEWLAIKQTSGQFTDAQRVLINKCATDTQTGEQQLCILGECILAAVFITGLIMAFVHFVCD